ncbi:hypothetical protein RvY_00401 [Ramazzottius varieornatus]|uniref:Uncharacterized protein n=1 Tax=Ramazzottius varieornatus TaxID=947166 RepID=A0A1D1UMK5_RAMVA|nr:hypothetical protein RvY_00401 [Ramazzottius varieornatus]
MNTQAYTSMIDNQRPSTEKCCNEVANGLALLSTDKPDMVEEEKPARGMTMKWSIAKGKHRLS